jgi:hypothetical protein
LLLAHLMRFFDPKMSGLISSGVILISGASFIT